MLVVARKAAGLTQVEVAQRLDKPQSFVSKYEHGERRLDFTEFVELADILSIDVGRFSEEYRQQLVDAQARNG
jgi:transcriptional regulator with XRE-family HTH domain